MADKVSRFAPTGSMDKDSDPRYVGKGDSNGDYIDARNIQCVPQDGNENGTISPTLGNEFAFSLGSVSQQNKRYRLTFDGDPLKQHEVRFLSTQRDADMVTPNGPNGGLMFNGTVTSFTTAFNNAISGSGVSWVLSTSTPGAVELELASYPMYQWYIETVGADEINPIIIAEAIPVDLAGPLKDIGSYDLLGDLFIHSTTQDNEPTETTSQVIGVGPISGGVLIGPLTELLFNGPHGLVAGQWISITNSNAEWLSGSFVVSQVVSPTLIRVPTSLAWGGTKPIFAVGQEVVTINSIGIGEIGVAQKNQSADSWTYTRLLRSVELNYVSKWEMEIDSRIKNQSKLQYFTDFYNSVRFFKYSGNYVTDGLLNFVNSANSLFYGAISIGMDATARPNDFGTSIRLVGQNLSGGALTPGNKRYAYQFITYNDTFTAWSDLSGNIPVYAKGPGVNDPITIKGNDPTFGPTTKSNTLEVFNIPIGVYKKIKIAVIESPNDNSISATALSPISIGVGDSSIAFTHTGEESDVTFVDVGEFYLGLAVTDIAYKAKTLTIMDNRLVLGNLVYRDISVLKDIASTFTHRLSYDEISGIGDFYDTNNVQPDYKSYGGYMEPENVFSKPSMVINETYRVSASFVMITGQISPPFWVDDIKIDTESINLANPSDNRRVGGGLPNYALNKDSPVGNYIINVPRIHFSNIDTNLLFDGIPIKSFITEIKFRFAKIKREVLASGFAIVGVSGQSIHRWRSGASVVIDNQGSIVPYPTWNDRFMSVGPSGAPVDLAVDVFNDAGTMYPHASDVDAGEVEANGPFVEERKFAAFYSPEITMGKLDGTTALSSDRLYVYYPVKRLNPYAINNQSVRGYISSTGAENAFGPNVLSTRGYPSSTCVTLAHPANTPQGIATDLLFSRSYRNIAIEESEILTEGANINIGGRNFSNSYVERFLGANHISPFIGDTNNGGDGSARMSYAKCLVVYCSNEIWPSDGVAGSGESSGTTYWNQNSVDRGIYYAQLVREDPVDKYGDKDKTYYSLESTSVLMSDVFSLQSEFAVFGGDAFTVSNVFRQRFKDMTEGGEVNGSTWSNLTSMQQYGRGLGMFYMAQSYMNMELVNVDPATPANTLTPSYPEDYIGINYADRRNKWVDDIRLNPPDIQGAYVQFYNEAYSLKPSSASITAFNSDILEYPRVLPGRITWTEADIYSSIFDGMLRFYPGQIHDLDTTFGPINKIENVNGELFSLQSERWQRQFFNARGILEASENTLNVLLGDGSVMARPGQSLSSYGAYHKWGACIGMSSGGKDMCFWFDAKNNLFMRFGADGTVVLSDSRKLRSFSLSATKWMSTDEPAFNQGVRSVWDSASKEVIWTFTGWRNVDAWVLSGQFPIISVLLGSVVVSNNAPSDSYEGFPRFFRCILGHAAFANTEPGVGVDWETYWEQISYDNHNYYSIFTIAFNEATNGFSTFYGHIPKTYLKWGNTFLSSHPTERNLIFEHRKGEPTTWYGLNPGIIGGINPKIEDAYIEAVINDLPEESKRFVSAEILSDNVPDRIEYRTKSQYTWSEPADFKVNDDQFRGFILNDATVSQSPRGNTRRMDGDYIKAKFFFIGGTMNKLYSMVVKLRGRLRDFRQ